MRLPWQPADMPSAAVLWDGAARGELVLPWCVSCSSPVTYPRDFCPRCHSTEIAARSLSGQGTVYSFGVETRAQPGCDLQPPFIVALIDLAEGGRLVSNVLAEPADISIGLPVHAVFTTDEEGRSIPRFVPDPPSTRSNP